MPRFHELARLAFLTAIVAVAAAALEASAAPAGTEDEAAFVELLRQAGFDRSARFAIRRAEIEARRRLAREKQWAVDGAWSFAEQWRAVESAARLEAVRAHVDVLVIGGAVSADDGQRRIDEIGRALDARRRERERPKLWEITGPFEVPPPTPPEHLEPRPSSDEMADRITNGFRGLVRRLQGEVAAGRLAESAARRRVESARRGLYARLDLIESRRRHAEFERSLAYWRQQGLSPAEMERAVVWALQLRDVRMDIARAERDLTTGLRTALEAEPRLLELWARERLLLDHEPHRARPDKTPADAPPNVTHSDR